MYLLWSMIYEIESVFLNWVLSFSGSNGILGESIAH